MKKRHRKKAKKKADEAFFRAEMEAGFPTLEKACKAIVEAARKMSLDDWNRVFLEMAERRWLVHHPIVSIEKQRPKA